jgi:hypothetical protein
MASEVMRALKNGYVQSVGRKQNGDIVARRGFFYKNGKTSADFEAIVQKILTKAGLNDKYRIVESGEIWRPFKGSASVSSQSHWFTVIREM